MVKRVGGVGVIELRQDLRQDRPVALLAEDALRLRRAQEVDEGSAAFSGLADSVTTATGFSMRIV